MLAVLHSPIVKGAVAGALAAAAVDYRAFRAWKTFNEVVAYDWRTAAFRILQGAVLGAVTSLGTGAL